MLSKHNEALKQAMVMARTEPSRALEVLDATLAQARAEGGGREVSVLARNAAAIHEQLHNFGRAIENYEEAILHDPHDPYLHLAIGRLAQLVGSQEEARSHFVRGLELATAGQDDDAIEVAQVALRKCGAPDDPHQG